MIRALARTRRRPGQKCARARVSDPEAVARRFAGSTVIAVQALLGLAFGLGLVAAADWWSGARILPLMFAL